MTQRPDIADRTACFAYLPDGIQTDVRKRTALCRALLASFAVGRVDLNLLADQ